MSSKTKSEAEKFEETIEVIENLLAAQPGCRMTVHRLKEEFKQMMGVPMPLHGFKDPVEMLEVAGDLFDTRLLADGTSYEVYLTVFRTEQAATMAKWNEIAYEKRNRGNSSGYYGFPSSSRSATRNRDINVNRPELVRKLSKGKPELVKFCDTVSSLAADAFDKTGLPLCLDDLIAAKHPDITRVDPSNFGVGGYYELLQLAEGNYSLNFSDGKIAILPNK